MAGEVTSAELKILITAVNNATATIQAVKKEMGEFVAGVKEGADAELKAYLERQKQGKEDLVLNEKKHKSQKDEVSSLEAVQEAYKAVKGAIQFAVAAFAAWEALGVANHFLEASAHAESLALGLETIGRQAGYTADELHRTNEALQKIGVSSDVAASSMTRLLSNGLTPNQIEGLTQSARQIALAFGKTVSEVEEQITFAVTTGMTRALKRAYGINIDAEAAYRQESARRLARGLSGDINPSERPAILAASLQGRVSQIVGDADVQKGLDTATQKMDAFRRATGELAQHIGDLLLPTFKKMLDSLTDITKAVDEFVIAAKKIEGIDDIIGVLKDAILVLAGAAGIAGLVAAVQYALPILTALFAGLLTPIGLVAAAIGVVSFTLYELYNRWKPFQGLVKGLAEAVIAFFDVDDSNFTSVWDAAIKAFTRATTAFKEAKEAVDLPLDSPLRGKKGSQADVRKADTAQKELDDRDRDAEEKRAVLRAETAAAARISQAKTEQAIIKQINAEKDGDDKIAYDHGILSLTEYYARRKEVIDTNLQAELKVLTAEQGKLAAQRDAIRGGGIDTDEQRGKITQQIEALEQQKTVIRQKASSDRRKIDSDAEKESYDLAIKYDTLIAQAQADSDSANAEAALRVLQLQMEEEAKALRAVGNERAAQALETKYFYLQSKAQQDALNASLDRERTIRNAITDAQEGKLKLAQSLGQVTDIEAQNITNAINLQRIRDKEAEIAAIKQRSAANGFADLTAKENDQVAQLNIQITNLYAGMETLGKKFRENFTDLLADGIETVVDRTKTLKQALHDIVSGFGTTLLKTGSRELAQATVKVIVDATGGNNGIFGQLGKIFGDKGTPLNPMWVKSVDSLAGGAGIGGILKDITAADEGATLSKEAVDKIYKTLGIELKDGADTVSAGLNEGEYGVRGLFNSLSKAIKGIFDSLSSDSGGGLGGFFNSLFSSSSGADLGFFGVGAVPYADGGLLDGPSHAQGGKLIEAEGGEFVVKKTATAKYRRLLEAINKDMMGKAVPRYASGGLIGAAASAAAAGVSIHDASHTTNSVKIEFNGSIPSTTANTPQGAEFGKRVGEIVKDQMIREMRPGGLLAPR